MPGRRQTELSAVTEHCYGETYAERARNELGGLGARPSPSTMSLWDSRQASSPLWISESSRMLSEGLVSLDTVGCGQDSGFL